jgi:hypothetical protein
MATPGLSRVIGETGLKTATSEKPLWGKIMNNITSSLFLFFPLSPLPTGQNQYAARLYPTFADLGMGDFLL